VIPVLTPVEMRAADARTILAGTPEVVLMERAGRAVARRVRHVLGGTYGRRVAVICGKGNNGGDGRVAAAALRAWGARVELIDLAALDTADGVAANVRRSMARADAIVDAMYGTGMRGALDGAAAELVALVDQMEALVVAVDIPSGVDGLTGAVHGPTVRADHTVTFAAPKLGLWFHPGRALAGTVTIADIGIDLGPDSDRTVLVEDRDVAQWIPARPVTTHKWRAGVLVIGGSNGMTGAPMLVGQAALRLGAGIVWAGLPGRTAELASGTEVITHAVPDDGSGRLNAAGAQAVLAMAGRFGVVVLGPGLGRADETVAAVRRLVGELDVPLVLDADGLTALEGATDILRSRSAPTVLTPHDGEFRRLTGAPPGDDRVACARELAVATNAVVLLKGPTTVVADPDGRVRLNTTGGPALATAGSGDVLSGMIGAFCARGMKGFDAAAAAAFVHGRAAEPDGHTGLIAGDLPARAAAALRQIVEPPASEA
jgi:yjeF C-terminal region, hydroxyethylthiazole kinase-related/yjeF N-terminal region